ncbi:aminotransferase class V-fold PLP-dependent enzyme [Cohnella sp. LGH]|uniref:aminotransferase class V-fold PLP-dependent enzyme n=1 Tax=Cohnella sp. LGH TaxID=1619153 RepID=UPI001AD95CCE|nr:aminotransferase class V-fold PLP-dependent enzyme [Cohnella sp. LGH]QTH40732.1 aminotransferase class V-fold PLP-dependent enzyme [Cohnella sp. LGH]
MNIYKRLGVKEMINAADSYTIIGGSLMPDEVIEAMSEAARAFVSIEELHDAVGKRLAELTRNEAAMVTGGAAAAMAIAAAACMAGADGELAGKLPCAEAGRNEILLYSCQNNGFVQAVRLTGAKVIELEDRNPDSDRQLREAITARTACLLYFVSTQFERYAPPLGDVISICRERGVPVIVDAAAQLPPVSNLWAYTEMGVDLVIFSGGKTLRGPQNTGLVVGRADLIAACRAHSSPRSSVGRPMKVSKESLVGLLAAVERYVGLDQEELSRQYEFAVETICAHARRLGLRAERLYPGPTGQSYPRAALYPDPSCGYTAESLQAELKSGEPAIWVGLSEDKAAILVNPLHLQDREIALVCDRLARLVG